MLSTITEPCLHEIRQTTRKLNNIRTTSQKVPQQEDENFVEDLDKIHKHQTRRVSCCLEAEDAGEAARKESVSDAREEVGRVAILRDRSEVQLVDEERLADSDPGFNRAAHEVDEEEGQSGVDVLLCDHSKKRHACEN